MQSCSGDAALILENELIGGDNPTRSRLRHQDRGREDEKNHSSGALESVKAAFKTCELLTKLFGVHRSSRDGCPRSSHHVMLPSSEASPQTVKEGQGSVKRVVKVASLRLLRHP